MRRILLLLSIALSFLVASSPLQAQSNRIVKGALIGGAIGLAAGDGLKDAIGGAIVGGGVGAISQKGHRGQKARKGAVKGAVVGAVIGGVAGDGIRDALKGAVIGGAAGAIISH